MELVPGFTIWHADLTHRMFGVGSGQNGHNEVLGSNKCQATGNHHADTTM